ncbi:hypothetical protein TVAG_224450 [Trichomonas vaginalis G3]|uniref:Uncharacterized protein n=1 Tax=Trichomonas vaginalis (strain ATCC PRA-98 / G3) TaxID=412133 RepID=A2DW68_TRIV3|nr:armadillo (ARM) repeat-containing protein family [Trichomonas vaginalis G3]EAY15369.1 hypothetical protein TVAG_224450 [Trichomonas vaginalis G3]KAI5496766.1 armadillo (ARM) repeat-containing protein family [Trichomonas vaginalis G3]|eukprot:XP_001327592.1 hypothetical protein [Trichomonas vaginalis G3]
MDEDLLLKEISGHELAARLSGILQIEDSLENSEFSDEFISKIYSPICKCLKTSHQQVKNRSLRIIHRILTDYFQKIQYQSLPLQTLFYQFTPKNEENLQMIKDCITIIINQAYPKEWIEILENTLLKSLNRPLKIFLIGVIREIPLLLSTEKYLTLLEDPSLDLAIEAQSLLKFYSPQEIRYIVSRVYYSNKMPKKNKQVILKLSKEIYENAKSGSIQKSPTTKRHEIPKYIHEILALLSQRKERISIAELQNRTPRKTPTKQTSENSKFTPIKSPNNENEILNESGNISENENYSENDFNFEDDNQDSLNSLIDTSRSNIKTNEDESFDPEFPSPSDKQYVDSNTQSKSQISNKNENEISYTSSTAQDGEKMPIPRFLSGQLNRTKTDFETATSQSQSQAQNSEERSRVSNENENSHLSQGSRASRNASNSQIGNSKQNSRNLDSQLADEDDQLNNNDNRSFSNMDSELSNENSQISNENSQLSNRKSQSQLSNKRSQLSNQILHLSNQDSQIEDQKSRSQHSINQRRSSQAISDQYGDNSEENFNKDTVFGNSELIDPELLEDNGFNDGFEEMYRAEYNKYADLPFKLRDLSNRPWIERCSYLDIIQKHIDEHELTEDYGVVLESCMKCAYPLHFRVTKSLSHLTSTIMMFHPEAIKSNIREILVFATSGAIQNISIENELIQTIIEEININDLLNEAVEIIDEYPKAGQFIISIVCLSLEKYKDAKLDKHSTTRFLCYVLYESKDKESENRVYELISKSNQDIFSSFVSRQTFSNRAKLSKYVVKKAPTPKKQVTPTKKSNSLSMSTNEASIAMDTITVELGKKGDCDLDELEMAFEKVVISNFSHLTMIFQKFLSCLSFMDSQKIDENSEAIRDICKVQFKDNQLLRFLSSDPPIELIRGLASIATLMPITIFSNSSVYLEELYDYFVESSGSDRRVLCVLFTAILKCDGDDIREKDYVSHQHKYVINTLMSKLM